MTLVVPTPDSFRALARSSPWRWRTLHFTHRGVSEQVEAWVRRPGHLRVRPANGPDVVEVGVPYTSSWLSTDPEFVAPEAKAPQEVTPVLRPDGLVAVRPDAPEIEYDDPMYGDYTWVAMLDPVELSHHVELTEPRAGDVSGREAWWATMRPEEGYDPRCPCCPLLWSEISDREELGDDWSPRRGTVYPWAYDVALDVETGVVVRCVPIGRSSLERRLEVDILEVDADLDHLFA